MQPAHPHIKFKRNPLFFAVAVCLIVLAVLLLANVGSVSATDTSPKPPSIDEIGAIPTNAAPPVAGRRIYTVQDPSAYVYTVRLGESWIAIAQRFDLSYSSLREANPELWLLRYEIIYPGDEMVIPTLVAGDMPAPLEYTIQYRDSWYKIADLFGVSYWDLRLDNILLWHLRGIYIRPGDVITVRGAQQNLDASASPADTPVEPAVQDAVGEESAGETAAETEAPADGAIILLPSSSAGPYLIGELPSGMKLYVVRPGDTWYALAAGNGVAFTDLRVLNAGLWAARGQAIRVGDQMIIPATAAPPPADIKTVPLDLDVTPAVGEELGEDGATPVATATSTPEPDVDADGERTGPIQAGTSDSTRLHLEVAPPTILYFVQAGENWAEVAVKAGVSVEALQAANPALRGQALQFGDAIRFP